MQLPSLNEVSAGSLPASRFPERAGAYLCDKCGKDITKNFYVRKGHGTPRLGPPTFYCEFGERYLSGTREWDQLGTNEQRTTLRFLRISAILTLPFFISLAALVAGIYEHNRTLMILGTVLTVLTSPLSIFLAFCSLEIRDIAASIYRTRVSKRQHK
jgi:hypothetical protein